MNHHLRSLSRSTKPISLRPPDFESFWKQTQTELLQIPPYLNILSRRDAIDVHPDLEYLEIEFPSLSHFGQGTLPIRGYIYRWKTAPMRPLVVHSHGYNSFCKPKAHWAKEGVNVVGCDIRGHGKSKQSFQTSKRGFVMTGLDNPDLYSLRFAVCDYMQMVNVAKTFFNNQYSRLILAGQSFSGALALMSEALLQTADLLAIGVPTFGWVQGRRFLVKRGSGREIEEFLEQHPSQINDVVTVLHYFDTVNFASFIRCPTLMGIGLEDDVVPSPTVFAIRNHMNCDVKVLEFPVSHSKDPREVLWEKFDVELLRLAHFGITESFNQVVYY